MERYKDGISAVMVAADHLTDDQLDMRPMPKARSAREVVHHLADAELHDSIRLRRMLVENTPVLIHWDEDRYKERLHYNRPIAASLDSLRTNATSNIELLRLLSDEQWRREGNQQRPWTLTVGTWLDEKVTHLHNCLMEMINAPSGGRVLPDTDETRRALEERARR